MGAGRTTLLRPTTKYTLMQERFDGDSIRLFIERVGGEKFERVYGF
jgi:hypothetical protein